MEIYDQLFMISQQCSTSALFVCNVYAITVNWLYGNFMYNPCDELRGKVSHVKVYAMDD